MSLLFKATDEATHELAIRVFNAHFERDPRLHTEYDDRRKQLMFEDILYNLSYLQVAKTFDDDKIFMDYARWVYHLLCHLMKDLTKERVKEHMVQHYRLLDELLNQFSSPEDAQKMSHHLHNAIRVTEEEAVHFTLPDRFNKGRYSELRQEYLDLLLQGETHKVFEFIDRTIKSGVSIEDVYIEIVQEAMYEVGNLWHQNLITVDQEHYCTSTSQMAMAQLFPLIFSQPRNGHKILSCCVGSELHEMGVRMLSDLFEYHGWDSIFLGAAVPVVAILHSIEANKPDLIALSVTMPQHLPACHELVTIIRATYPDLKIAVGGRAFQTTEELWKKWDVDISVEDAGQLIAWAKHNIIDKRQ